MTLDILFISFCLFDRKHLHYLAFPSCDFERTWWRLFLKPAVCTYLDIYVFITRISFILYDLVIRYGISVSQMNTDMFAVTIWSFTHSWNIFGFVTRATRRVPLVEQELPTLPEHLNLPSVSVVFLLRDH